MKFQYEIKHYDRAWQTHYLMKHTSYAQQTTLNFMFTHITH